MVNSCAYQLREFQKFKGLWHHQQPCCFIDGETETRSGQAPCPKSHSVLAAQYVQGLSPGSCTSSLYIGPHCLCLVATPPPPPARVTDWGFSRGLKHFFFFFAVSSRCLPKHFSCSAIHHPFLGAFQTSWFCSQFSECAYSAFLAGLPSEPSYSCAGCSLHKEVRGC